MKNVIKFKVPPPNFNSKHATITATFKSSFVKFGKGKVLNHPKTCKWDNQGAVLFHSLLNQKDTQEKLGKLRFDLESSSNTNAVQKAVKKFTGIILECVDKTLRIKKRGKVKVKPKKLWYSDCTLLRKQFTRITKLLQKDPKNPYIMDQCQKIRKSYKHTIKVCKLHWEIRVYWKSKTLLVPFKITKRCTPSQVHQILSHHNNGLNTFQNCYILKMKGKKTKNFFNIMILIEI